MGTVTSIHARRIPRADVDWSATARVGESGIMTGRVLDHSAYGFFFVPEVSYLQGFVEGESALDEIDFGEEITLSITSRGKEAVTMQAVVRWAGYSQRHGAYGLGAEIVREAKIAA